MVINHLLNGMILQAVDIHLYSLSHYLQAFWLMNIPKWWRTHHFRITTFG